MRTTKWFFYVLTVLALFASAYPQAKNSKQKSSPTSSQASSNTSTSSKLLDINTASQDELKSLPGIGDAYSAAIIKNRPYANKSQLVSRKVIPQATYEKISDRIIAKQNKSAKNK